MLDNLPQIIFRSVFFGFACWTVVWIISKRINKKKTVSLSDSGVVLDLQDQGIESVERRNILSRMDSLAIGLLRVAGIYSIISILIYLPDPDYFSHAFGVNWLSFWIYPLTYFVLPQLFWIQKIRNSNFFRIVYAIWTFGVLHIVQFIIVVTSFHRDEVFDNTIWFGLITEWIIYVAIFSFLILCGFMLSKVWGRRMVAK